MIRIGITQDLIAQPLFYGILEDRFDHPFRLLQQTARQNCRGLLENKLEVALVTPIDYAKHGSNWKLVKDMSVYTESASRYALLFFQENLPGIDRIALPVPDTQYHLLARLILNEFFEIEAEWESLDRMRPLEQLLSLYPACLLEGEDALNHYRQSGNYLDIPEEWHDKTGLSYVHQLLAVRKDIEDTGFLKQLHQSQKEGMENLMTIAEKHAASRKGFWDTYFELINEIFRYYPNEATWDELRQYYEYVFYYGYIDYLPELHFCE